MICSVCAGLFPVQGGMTLTAESLPAGNSWWSENGNPKDNIQDVLHNRIGRVSMVPVWLINKICTILCESVSVSVYLCHISIVPVFPEDF